MTIAPWRTAGSRRRPSEGPFADTDVLLTVAEGLARSASTWPGMDDPSERCWRTIAATEAFEAWVIAWPVGGSIELHDHGDSSGGSCRGRGVVGRDQHSGGRRWFTGDRDRTRCHG